MNTIKTLLGYESVFTLAYCKRVLGDPTLLDGTQTFHTLNGIRGREWYADPLPFEENGRRYVFCEIFDRILEKGIIGVSEMNENGELSQPVRVLEEPFHLSFPFVFRLGERIFMLPETSADRSLIFYEAEEFPFKWIRHTRVPSERQLVDSVIYNNAEQFYLFTSILDTNIRKSRLCVMNLTFEKNQFKISAPSELQIAQEGYVFDSRGAGPLFFHQNRLIRPSQESNDEMYGRSIALNEINVFNKSEYSETRSAFILPSAKIQLINSGMRIEGLHTYSLTDWIEIIDVKVSILLEFRQWLRKVVSKLKKGAKRFGFSCNGDI